MKLLISLLLVALIVFVVHKFSVKKFGLGKGNKQTKWHAISLASIVTVMLLGLVGFGMYRAANAPDMQCENAHRASSQFPAHLTTAQDFFDGGNYFYDIGDCTQAIAEYTNAIQSNPVFAQAYNNRAYTYMRLRDYKAALSDLNMAISLSPNYVEALMNRGDIYNYYYAINRQKAIADYDRVIALGKDSDQSSSVCGHKAMAQTNNFIPLVLLKFIFNRGNC